MTSFVGSLLLASAIKGSVLLVLAAIAAFVLRRASAAMKHLVWTMALAGVFLVPLLGATLPSVSVAIAVPSLAGSTDKTAAGGAAVSGTAVPAPSLAAWAPSGAAVSRQADVIPAGAQSGGGSTASIAARAFGSLDMWTVLVGVWAAGAAGLLLHFVIGLWNASRLVRRSRPVEDDTWQARLESALDRVGFHRGVVLLVSDATTVPITCGIRRPVILLPSDAFTWSDERATVVLLHEAAHIRRHDCLVQYLAQVTRALHWFNPLAWVAAARLTAERERACDDLVLAAGTRGSSYAAHLLEIARSLRGRQKRVAALAMARPSELEGRLLSILDGARPHRLPSRGALMAMIGVATVGITGIAAIHMEPRVEARALPVPTDLSHVVAQGLPTPTPTPTPTPAAAPMPAPTPPGRIDPVPHAGKPEEQGRQGRQQTNAAGNDDNDDENPEESKADAAARDAIARALLAALKDEDAEVRRSAMASLTRVRSPLALEPMIAALRDSDPGMRAHAAFSLGQLHDQRAVPALTAALADQSAEVRESTVFALGQLHAESAVEGLRQALKDSVPSIRSQAAFTLGQIHSTAAVPGLLDALKDADATVRGQAAFALGQLGSRDAVPGLIAALKDANADVRRQAAFALGQVGDAGAVDALMEALKDQDSDVRRTVAFALGQAAR